MNEKIKELLDKINKEAGTIKLGYRLQLVVEVQKEIIEEIEKLREEVSKLNQEQGRRRTLRQ